MDEEEEYTFDLGNGEVITLTMEDFIKLIVERTKKKAIAMLMFENHGIMDASITTPFADINDFFLYLTHDTLAGKFDVDDFKRIMNALGLYMENLKREYLEMYWGTDKDEYIVMAMECSNTLGFLFALEQIVITKVGAGSSFTVMQGNDTLILPERVSREEWIKSFKKTLETVRR